MPDPMDATRFDALLQRLAGFTASGAGVTRLAYDGAWCAAHRWLADQARERGLAATTDAAGNLLFHDPALHPGDLGEPVTLVGSHLDSVRDGGRYDGAYGVLAGLVLAAEHRGRPGPQVVGFVTAEEEQSRFDSQMMGARALLGLVRDAELDEVRDRDGVTWRVARDAAERAGCASPLVGGETPMRPRFRATVTIEPHIEQGPVLEADGIPIGLVTAIAGFRRLRMSVIGEPRHAGTTPIEMRRDALAGAAEMVLVAETLARESGGPARITAGNLTASPGLFNVSPGAAELWLEVRHSDGATLARLATELGGRCGVIATRRGLTLRTELVTSQDPTPLSAALVEAGEITGRERGIATRHMVSGAGHDSMEFARAGLESTMVFVPSRGGISHAPDEYTGPEALWTGVCFTSALLERIAVGQTR
ncbi:MAG: Zn-dependent hydrolase [Candidatus Eisenbacteria bacterium]